MMKEKFKMVLEGSEEVLWCSDTNVSAFTKKKVVKTFLLGLFPPIAVVMLGIPYSLVLLVLSIMKIIPIWIGISHFAFSLIVCIIFILILVKDGNNTYFCITDKRVILRSGAFNNKFVNYSLKNVGTVEVNGSFFDRKGENPSADLIITVKDYHANTDGNSSPQKLKVLSLNNAYEAYKLLNELVMGNNEVFRIKVEP